MKFSSTAASCYDGSRLPWHALSVNTLHCSLAAGSVSSMSVISMTNASLDEVTVAIGDMAAALALTALTVAAAKYSDDNDDDDVFCLLVFPKCCRGDDMHDP